MARARQNPQTTAHKRTRPACASTAPVRALAGTGHTLDTKKRKGSVGVLQGRAHRGVSGKDPRGERPTKRSELVSAARKRARRATSPLPQANLSNPPPERCFAKGRQAIEGRAGEQGPKALLPGGHSPLGSLPAVVDAPVLEGRAVPMELNWGDEPSPGSHPLGAVQRWVRRGNALLRELAEHGVARHEYRADLDQGRFVWVAPAGRVSAEARALLLCRWIKCTSVLVMGWADVHRVALGRIHGRADEIDDVSEEAAFEVVMELADVTGADYLYCVNTPHALSFLALSDLSFSPECTRFVPTAPVGLVVGALGELRQEVQSRAQRTSVLHARLSSIGHELLHDAEYAYRTTDWVARLERTGRRLLHLAAHLPQVGYRSVAAGQQVDDWLGREETIELSAAISLLEDEWRLFV